MAIDLSKTIVDIIQATDRVGTKRLTKYLHLCDKCNKERGYFIKTFDKYTKNGGFCRSCATKSAPPKSSTSREKISKARLGKCNWKGKHSAESKEKMRQAALKRKSRSGHLLSEATKKKISCTRRKINLIDFDGFLTKEDESQRRLFKTQGLHWKCFEHARYVCDYCNKERTDDNTLNAHHLDGWNWAINQRFNPNNLVALCENCHAQFHVKYGKGHNTKEQYEEFKCRKP